MTDPFDIEDVPQHSTEGMILGTWGKLSQHTHAVEQRLRDNRIRMERIRNLHVVVSNEEE